MSTMSNYLIAMVCIGTTNEEQEAIETAIFEGWYKPKYNFDLDRVAIERQLLVFVEKFQQLAHENAAKNAPMREFIDSIGAMNAVKVF